LASTAICPAGERLRYYYTNQEKGLTLRRYWTNNCQTCAIKHRCTSGKMRRITRWEHEHLVDAVQRRLDNNPQAMRTRRETVEHPFGTIKARMGATHFLMKRLRNVRTEMALHVLAYNRPCHEHHGTGTADAGHAGLDRPHFALLKAKIRLLEPLQTQNGPFLDQAHKINAESYQRQSMRHQTGPAKTFLHGQDPKRP